MGSIFTLDLGQRCGFASGPPGAVPRSGVVLLKQTNEPRAVALGNLIAWLSSTWTEELPALVVKEAPLPLQAFSDRANSEAGVLMAYGLHGIVEAMAKRFALRLEQAHPATVRKHFIGRARMGARADTKSAVIQRAHLLGLMPRSCRDDNRADALALWDYSVAMFARHNVTPGGLYLFGESAA